MWKLSIDFENGPKNFFENQLIFKIMEKNLEEKRSGGKLKMRWWDLNE